MRRIEIWSLGARQIFFTAVPLPGQKILCRRRLVVRQGPRGSRVRGGALVLAPRTIHVLKRAFDFNISTANRKCKMVTILLTDGVPATSRGCHPACRPLYYRSNGPGSRALAAGCGVVTSRPPPHRSPRRTPAESRRQRGCSGRNLCLARGSTHPQLGSYVEFEGVPIHVTAATSKRRSNISRRSDVLRRRRRQ